jgi:mannose-1-phosphate guanylyltransferase
MDYAVIMAGGTGKRLWPLSREKRPKQVLRLIDGETLLRRCFDRVSPLFDKRNILVLTNAEYSDIVRENLPELPAANVIAEPAVRDTAGAVGLAAAVLTKFDADATMAVVTADQLIEPDEVFQSVMKDGLKFVNENPDQFVTFGIKPTSPSTQLGYVKLGADDGVGYENSVFKVDAFKEKPDEATAKEYLVSGKYCWNSGMFVWKAATVLKSLTASLPEMAEPLNNIKTDWDTPDQQQTLERCFLELPRISIDYAVMEKAENVHAIRLDCKWLDMGSFGALADIVESDEDNNFVIAEHSHVFESKDNIIVTEDDGHLIAVMGVDNLFVAHSEDATLICPVDQSHRLKELLEEIKKHKGTKFL